MLSRYATHHHDNWRFVKELKVVRYSDYPRCSEGSGQDRDVLLKRAWVNVWHDVNYQYSALYSAHGNLSNQTWLRSRSGSAQNLIILFRRRSVIDVSTARPLASRGRCLLFRLSLG